MGTAPAGTRALLADQRILIVEEDLLIAMMVTDEVSERRGTVVGSSDIVNGAIEGLDAGPVFAAIMDANLHDRDFTPVALRLLEMAVSFVIYSGTGLPADPASSDPGIPLEMKPGRPVDRLIDILRGGAEAQRV